MVVKEIPVDVGNEATEIADEVVEEVLEEIEEIQEEEAKPNKPVAKITKATAKRQSKKEDPTVVDLKQRMPCPVCKKMYTLHSLLYTHKCTIDAREKKKKSLGNLLHNRLKRQSLSRNL